MMHRLTWLLLFGVLGGLRAQGEVAPPAGPPVLRKGAELTWNVDPVIIELDYEQRILYLIQDVQVTIDDLVVRCDNLVAWLQPELGRAEGEPAGRPDAPAGGEGGPEIVPGTQERLAEARRFVREVYVEGHVILRRGEEVTRAERAYLDLVTGRGLILDAVTRRSLPGRDETSPLVIRADEIRVLSKSRWQAQDVQLTTSPFARPSTHLQVGQLELVKDPPGWRTREGRQEQVENFSYEARDNVFHVGGTPLLWLPDFVGDSAGGATLRYLEDVRYGRSSRFGHEPGLTIGDDIRDGEERVWGHWSVPVDWFSKRGWGVGARLDYATEDYRGWLVTQYQRDRGEDRFFGRPPTKNRGRITWNHRHWLPYGVQLDLETNLFSDRGYYPTWFENEEKTDKPPENLVYLRKAYWNQQLSLLTSYRFNDWLTTTERLPELRFDLIAEPVLDLGETTLLLNTSARVGKVRRKVDEALNVPGRSSWRVDLDTLLEAPLLVGPVKLTPFAGLRYTHYDRDLLDRDRDRLGFTFGGTLTMQAWKTWDVRGGIFGLDGLRHVVLPEITFRQTTGVQVAPEELAFFDEVETFDDVQVIELSLRNLFQTVRHRRTGPAVANVLNLELELDYFPNAGRDNGGDPFGNLEADLAVRFSDDLQLVSDFEVNWYGGGLQVFDAAVGYTPGPEFQGYLGFRHFENTYDAVFVQLNWRIEEKWLLNLDTSYDLDDDRGIDHRATLARIGADWVFEVSARADLGENDFSVRFSFSPRALYRSILQPRSLREEPRLWYLGQGLDRTGPPPVPTEVEGGRRL